MADWLITRDYKKQAYTIGNFKIDGRWFCSSLEDTDRSLESSMKDADIRAVKIYAKTAIPRGCYKIGFTYSAKFAGRSWAKPYGGRVISIEGVRGFEGVRIHPGNTAEDTSGCVLVGLNKIKGRLVDSTKTYLDLVDHYLLPAIAKGEDIYLTIR